MEDHIHHQNEHKTRLVVILTAVTMVVEIGFGYYTNSMALLADGFHMSSHAFALGLSWIAYVASRKYSNTGKLSFNKDKLLALSGFTSAIIAMLTTIATTPKILNNLLFIALILFLLEFYKSSHRKASVRR